MKIQIIKYSPDLKSIWGIHLWSIHEVVKIKNDWYYIKAKSLYGNNYGEIVEIRVKKDEVKELEPHEKPN